MNYVVHLIFNFLLYISIPLAIRYVIWRKPINNRWIVIGLLVPVFIGFCIAIQIQRIEQDKKLFQEMGMPYTPMVHMIGSPILYFCMALSYSILRRGNKHVPNGIRKDTAHQNNEENMTSQGSEGETKKIRTHYENLHVPYNASLDDIKTAYVNLAQKYQPDNYTDARNRIKAERITRIITEAYDVLSKSESRKLHDQWIDQIMRKTEQAEQPAREYKESAPAQSTKFLKDITAGQRKTLVIYVAVTIVVIMGIFAPWTSTFNRGAQQSERPMGYHFIFSPPPPASDYNAFGVKLDLLRLGLQWTVTISLAGTLYFLLKESKRNE